MLEVSDQAILEEGFAKGIVLGRIEALIEARREGRIEGKLEYGREVLYHLGQIRWGAPDAATREFVDAILDPQVLQKLIERVLNAKSWQELLEERR